MFCAHFKGLRGTLPPAPWQQYITTLCLAQLCSFVDFFSLTFFNGNWQLGLMSHGMPSSVLGRWCQVTNYFGTGYFVTKSLWNCCARKTGKTSVFILFCHLVLRVHDSFQARQRKMHQVSLCALSTSTRLSSCKHTEGLLFWHLTRRHLKASSPSPAKPFLIIGSKDKMWRRQFKKVN